MKAATRDAAQLRGYLHDIGDNLEYLSSTLERIRRASSAGQSDRLGETRRHMADAERALERAVLSLQIVTSP